MPDPNPHVHVCHTADPLPPAPGDGRAWTKEDDLTRQIVDLNWLCDFRDEEIAALRAELAERDAKLEGRKKLCEAKSAANDRLVAEVSSLRARLARAEAIERKAQAVIASRRGPNLRDGDTARTSLAIVALSDFEALAATLAAPSPAVSEACPWPGHCPACWCPPGHATPNCRACVEREMARAERVGHKPWTTEPADSPAGDRAEGDATIAELRAELADANEQIVIKHNAANRVIGELNSTIADLRRQLATAAERGDAAHATGTALVEWVKNRSVTWGREGTEILNKHDVSLTAWRAAKSRGFAALAAYPTPTPAPAEANQS